MLHRMKVKAIFFFNRSSTGSEFVFNWASYLKWYGPMDQNEHPTTEARIWISLKPLQKMRHWVSYKPSFSPVWLEYWISSQLPNLLVVSTEIFVRYQSVWMRGEWQITSAFPEKVHGRNAILDCQFANFWLEHYIHLWS